MGGNDLAQTWKYNGVQLNEDLSINLYEMDLRSYDPAIARFNGIDPVVHYFQGTSVAFDNNPIFWADPSGANGIVGTGGFSCYDCMSSGVLDGSDIAEGGLQGNTSYIGGTGETRNEANKRKGIVNKFIKNLATGGKSYDDWFKNAKGEVTWFDNTASSFTNESGEWTNVGSNLGDVMKTLGIPSTSSFTFTNTEWMLFTGAGYSGRTGGSPVPVVFSGGASLRYSLNVSGTENGNLVSGVSSISGVNIDATVGVDTNAPGLSIFGVLGGNFSINRRWQASGISPDYTSSNFKGVDYQVVYGGNGSGASGTARLTMSMNYYKRMTRNFSQNAGGLNDITLKLKLQALVQQNGQKKRFNFSILNKM